MRLGLIGFVLCLATVLVCVSAEGPVEDNCAHQWEPFNLTEHGYDPEMVHLVNVDAQRHKYMMPRPSSVCKLCGERLYQGEGTLSNDLHSYIVDEWHELIPGQSVFVTYKCAVCEYMHQVELSYQSICDGSAPSCLFGGACDQKAVGYMTTDGLVLPQGEWILPAELADVEKRWDIAIVYDMQDKTFCFTDREYCAVCGRPRIPETRQTTQVFYTNWNGLPIMTEEYFLEVDMPDNLPYQLIDNLRQATGSV